MPLSGNVVSANRGNGLTIESSNVTLTGNVASGNGGAGVLVELGNGISLAKNAVLANGGPGVEISALAGAVALVANDFAGNDRGSGGYGGVLRVPSVLLHPAAVAVAGTRTSTPRSHAESAPGARRAEK